MALFRWSSINDYIVSYNFYLTIRHFTLFISTFIYYL